MFDFSDTIFHPEHAPLKIEFPEGDQVVSHLICDIDDVDKEKAVKLYEKVQEKENRLIVELDKEKAFQKKDPMKSSKIIITPIDDYTPPTIDEREDYFEKEKDDSFRGKYNLKGSKMFRKQPSKMRIYDEDNVYDETIRVNKHNNRVKTNLNLNKNSGGHKLYKGKFDIGLK